MAANHIQIKTTNGTPIGRELLDVAEGLADLHRRLDAIAGAMVQMINGDSAQDASFPLVATLFGVTADDGVTLSNSKARTLFNEVNSTVGNAGPSIKQLANLLKQ
jgi:hypothetical protein